MKESNNKIIINLIELIDNFSVMIYKRDNNESYRLLLNIIDKLDSIVGAKSTFILENKFKIYIYDLTNKLPDLLDAFENNDNVLISDILKCEIKPLLKEIIK
jgi:hypothetical protein